MPHLVLQRRGDAVPDHSLTRDANERHWVRTTARQTGARSSDRSAEPTMQRAQDRWALERSPREQQRLGGRDVESGEQHTGTGLAALRDHLREEVELRQRVLELQAQHPVATLLFRRWRDRALATQPSKETLGRLAHHAPAED